MPRRKTISHTSYEAPVINKGEPLPAIPALPDPDTWMKILTLCDNETLKALYDGLTLLAVERHFEDEDIEDCRTRYVEEASKRLAWRLASQVTLWDGLKVSDVVEESCTCVSEAEVNRALAEMCASPLQEGQEERIIYAFTIGGQNQPDNDYDGGYGAQTTGTQDQSSSCRLVSRPPYLSRRDLDRAEQLGRVAALTSTHAHRRPYPLELLNLSTCPGQPYVCLCPRTCIGMDQPQQVGSLCQFGCPNWVDNLAREYLQTELLFPVFRIPEGPEIPLESETSSFGSETSTAFISACRNGHASIVRAILKKNPGSVNPNAQNDSPFVEACSNGHLEVAKALLELEGSGLGLDPSRRVDTSACNNAALRRAAGGGHVEIVRLLLSFEDDRRVDPTVMCNAALREACRHGHLAVVRLLLELDDDREVDPNDVDVGPDAFTLACEGGHLGVVRELLRLNGDRKVRDLKEFSADHCPLIAASRGGHLPVVRELSHASSLKGFNQRVRCAIASALQAAQVKTAMFLMDAVANRIPRRPLRCSYLTCGHLVAFTLAHTSNWTQLWFDRNAGSLTIAILKKLHFRDKAWFRKTCFLAQEFIYVIPHTAIGWWIDLRNAARLPKLKWDVALEALPKPAYDVAVSHNGVSGKYGCGPWPRTEDLLRKGHLEVVRDALESADEYLLQYRIPKLLPYWREFKDLIHRDLSILPLLANRGQIDLFSEILRTRAPHSFEFMPGALECACQGGCVEIVRLIVKECPMDSYRIAFKRAVRYAIKNGNLAVFRELRKVRNLFVADDSIYRDAVENALENCRYDILNDLSEPFTRTFERSSRGLGEPVRK